MLEGVSVRTPTTHTFTTQGKVPKPKKKKVTGLVAWIVKTFKPNYHLALNPPKGKKRLPRKEGGRAK